ncbi:MAG: MFS transporter [Actinomycetota bacterium]
MSKSQLHDPFAALRFRNYRLFFTGNVLSSTGSQMQSVAVGWELYERTGSALVLGGIGLVQVLPVILLTLPAGHIADRRDRQRTVLFTQVMLAVCSLGLAVLSYTQGSIFLIYTCLLLSGVARAFNKPASDALLPQLVPLRIFSNAATWNSSAYQLASVVGPAIGGLVIALQKNALGVYIFDAILAFACFSATALISGQQAVRVTEETSLKTLAAGLHFVWENQIILAAIALDLFAVLLGGAVTLLPIFAKDILQVGPEGLGWLRAAPSIGALLMAVALAHLPPMKQAGKALLWSVAGFGVVTIIFGLSRWFWLSLVMLALSGALDNISVVIRHTLVQVRTPDYLRGRVSAVNSVFISTSNELGGFESGLIAAIFGPVISVVGGGIGTIAVVLAVAWIWPEIRKLGSLQEG